MTKVKLCGMTRPEDIEAVNRLLPDYIGFIFWEKSFRNVTIAQAKALKDALHPDIQAVGVFVDALPETIFELYNQGIIDVAQLHGSEDEEYIKRIRQENIPVIKAFKVEGEESLKKAIASSADYIIFDPGKGDGAVFNWKLIGQVDRPFFLAGGLHPDNVSEAIETVHPYAVDVSSGIETDKRKDPEKMKLFVDRARAH